MCVNEEVAGLEDKQLMSTNREGRSHFHSFSLRQLKPDILLRIMVLQCLAARKGRVYVRPTPHGDEVKVKCPCVRHEGIGWGVAVHLHLFLSSALHGGE
jgi:hypothetical protein